MHGIDWMILVGTLLFIVGYGIWKTRNVQSNEDFLKGGNKLSWWVIGLSVMATQASAITFLSTPGQAYEEGMGFVQFYFGLPLAMIILSIFFLPTFYKLKVYTAYEFLEKRFNAETRTLTSVLFLIQRGLAAGLTIYAPAIILNTILGWSLPITILFIGGLVILYTVAGGTLAVSQTHKQQMLVIFVGMVAAFYLLLQQMPEGIGFSEAMQLASANGKLNIIDTKFDLSNRYNIWTGFLGGTFLFLSYFGTDQSQVQRYLSGRSLTEGRLGLLFNAIAKVPMQFFILLTGVLVFVFFQFSQSPLHFNPANVTEVTNSEYASEYEKLNREYEAQFAKSKTLAEKIAHSESAGDEDVREYAQLREQERELRSRADALIIQAQGGDVENNAEIAEDTDYVFIHYILNYFPIGIIGLLLAVIFSAAMSSTASEINALTTTSVVDIFQRYGGDKIQEKYSLLASKAINVLWGIIAICFALMAKNFDNLIEAVNIIGSLFYGTILGIFMVAFFIKFIKGRAVLIAAIISECMILLSYKYMDIAYLWLNAYGCLFVIVLSLVIQLSLNKAGKTE